jgi:hypothetical protein
MRYLIFLLLFSGCTIHKKTQVVSDLNNRPHLFDEPYRKQYILMPSHRISDTALVPAFTELYLLEYDIWVHPVDTCIFPCYNLLILN